MTSRTASSRTSPRPSSWPGLRASFLLSIREDALAKLDRFKGRIPNVLGNYLRLDHLDRDSAREAIVGPVDRYNELSSDEAVEIEPALVEAVLDQVAAGKVELGRERPRRRRRERSGGRIEAPFLQLVMARLWDAERGGGLARAPARDARPSSAAPSRSSATTSTTRSTR